MGRCPHPSVSRPFSPRSGRLPVANHRTGHLRNAGLDPGPLGNCSGIIPMPMCSNFLFCVESKRPHLCVRSLGGLNICPGSPRASVDPIARLHLLSPSGLDLVSDIHGSRCSAAETQIGPRISRLNKPRIHARSPLAGMPCPTVDFRAVDRRRRARDSQLWL